jgi:chromosomal replication initiator protein
MKKIYTYNLVSSLCSFDNFIVGPSNYGAYKAAMWVTESLGNKFNPLLVNGKDGLGKTHLLHAIGNSLVSHRPHTRVRYTTAEEITAEIVFALRKDRMKGLIKKYRTLDLLLVDDMQVLKAKPATQREFSDIFYVLCRDSKQIVMATDGSPMDIKLLIDVDNGHAVAVHSPEMQTRIAIIRRKAGAQQITLPEDVIHYVAEKTQRNIRQIEGCITKLHAYASSMRKTIVLSSVETLLSDVIL